MSHDQRYISDELCHFVGRGKTDDQQYDLLVNKILKTGWLTHPPHHNAAIPRTAGLDLSKPISTDEAIKYQVVCFCDIPVSDLSIHIKKYGKFGLSFKKSFLIDRGACPVFYI
ncbi:MAG: abortive infection system antitoxin AbiGi family protein, partial [Bdellovibrionales bacterium]